MKQGYITALFSAFCFFSTLGFSAGVTAAEYKIDAVSAFHAHVTPTVQISATGARFNTLVRGSMRMDLGNGELRYFTTYCRGHDLQEKGVTVAIDSNCEYIDADGDKILAGMKIGEEVFTIRGGTGKWRDASGQIRGSELQETPSDLAPDIRLFISRGVGELIVP